MEESFIPSSEFETANNAVNNILGQPVEEIEITDILPPLNDITDSNKVFKGKLSVLFVDMRKSTDLTDELKSKKMVKVYRSLIYRCFDMYEEAYEILCVQAEHSTWLNQYVLEDVVKQSGHWAKLKGILEKRVYEKKDYRECLDKLKSMGY